MDFNQRIQPPSLVQAPLELSLSPQVSDGGLFRGGKLSWSLENGDLLVTDVQSGAPLHCWRPSRAGHEVSLVCELRTNGSSLLVVALKNNGDSILGVLSANFDKLIRAVSVPNPITALHAFNYEGFGDEGVSQPQLFPNSVLSLFNGIVAIGSDGGRTHLVDLQLGSGAPDCTRDHLTSPLPMFVIQGPVSGRELVAVSETSHVTIEINKGSFQRGKLQYPGPNPLPSPVLVSALYYSPQISCLFVGFSFGGIEVYQLSSLELLYRSPLPPHGAPVTHFCYVEPENDPRNFVYVWVVRGFSRLVPNSCGAVISLYQLVYSKKSTLPTGQTLYNDFQGCALRFEQALNGEPQSDNALESPAARLVGCTTVLRHQREHPGNAPELDLSLSAFVWAVPQQQTRDVRVFVGLFDVNQWYHSQMPPSIRWKSKNKLSGLFGCSYFAFYDISQAASSPLALDMLIEGVTPFHSELPKPEIFMWPSAIRFSLKLLTSKSVDTCHFYGAQRMVLAAMDKCRGSLYAQPGNLFQQCVRTELLSHDMSHDLTSQRCALLGVALSHPLPSRVLTVFAESWAGAGMDQTVISRWMELTRSELELSMKAVCAKLGDDGFSVSSHWRKLSAIQLFLERLLSLGLERETSVCDAVAQLLLTVMRYQKVFEVTKFFNEQGLLANYPSAVLRRRYITLRGGGELKSRLCVDCVMEDLNGGSSYPPDSLPSFMAQLSTLEPLLLHSLVLYLLCDLDSLEGPSLVHHTQYASHQELPVGLVNTIQALWITDNLKFKDPAYSIPTRVLFIKPTNHPLFSWQHGMITEKLVKWGEFKTANRYIGIHGKQMTGLEEIKIKLEVQVANGLVDNAFSSLVLLEGSENYDELFSFFLDCCVAGKSLYSLMDLPFSKQAELTFVLYLERHPQLACQEFLVFYFLLRSRFVEAMAVQENIRELVKSEPDPCAMERCGQRDTLLAGLGALVPKALQHVKMSGASRGGGSKVKVPVDKTLSAVVAKAVRSGDLAGRGGEVYSLIQSIAAQRDIPNNEVTPLRPVRGSVTQLSHTPFLSTPISVRKVRGPLTAGRVAPVVTPRPQRGHMTPGSQTIISSQLRGLKVRMASILSHSDPRMDTSTIQTPSPPTSILKGTRPPSRLAEGKKIRFDDSPLTPQMKPPSQFTPAVPSSLSTTASVAMITPLPSSEDDDDLFESPAESPSQLATPTPSLPQDAPKLSTQLTFNEVDSPGAKDNDIHDPGNDIHDSSIKDDLFIAAADEPMDGGAIKRESSPLAALKLARESLSPSDRKAPLSRPSLSSSGQTSSSFRPVVSGQSLLFSPIPVDPPPSRPPFTRDPPPSRPPFTSSASLSTPAQQLFSPVPFMSNLPKQKQETTQPLLKERAQPLFTSMAPSVSGLSYNFTPPTRVSIKSPPPTDSSPTEPMSFVFSPPLTRSAARRKRGDSVLQEGSPETRKRPTRGRPRKTPQPSTPPDSGDTLVTPPTMARPPRDTRQKTKAKPVKTGVGSRRSARLLGSRK